MRDLNYLKNAYDGITKDKVGLRIKALLEIIEVQDRVIKGLEKGEVKEKEHAEETEVTIDPNGYDSGTSYGGSSEDESPEDSEWDAQS